MYETVVNGRTIVVEKLSEVTSRRGAIIKEEAVLYRDTRNNKESVRPKAEFERMFRRLK